MSAFVLSLAIAACGQLKLEAPGVGDRAMLISPTLPKAILFFKQDDIALYRKTRTDAEANCDIEKAEVFLRVREGTELYRYPLPREVEVLKVEEGRIRIRVVDSEYFGQCGWVDPKEYALSVFTPSLRPATELQYEYKANLKKTAEKRKASIAGPSVQEAAFGDISPPRMTRRQMNRQAQQAFWGSYYSGSGGSIGGYSGSSSGWSSPSGYYVGPRQPPGHYVGGVGSSHRGGTYVNPNTGNRYQKRQ